MNRNSTYWQNRFKQLEETEHASSVEEYAKIQEQFDIAQRRIQKEINSWYGRFAKENGVSMEAARKMLDDKEMAELKWDVNEYIKYGQKNAIDPKWMHQLENASARVHISRLEAVKLLTQAECEKLYGNLTDDITHHLSHQYEDAYYHTAYEIAKGTGVGVNFAAVNERKLEKIINKPWAADGKNFAVRLGENKANLINNIHKSLVQMTLTGENPDKAILMLSRTMNGDKARAGRIIMTESAYFTELANKDSYNELGVQQYEIIATLDSHTSEICQEMDGKVLDMKDFEPGVTAPPFHPNCRSTTAPYFEDDFGVVGERAARDENNKVYYVPANTTYKKWAKNFVNSTAEDFDEMSSMDFMGKPSNFRAGDIEIKAYEIDGSDGKIFTQTFTIDAQNTIKMLKESIKKEDVASNFNKIVVTRKIDFAGYDHASDTLFVSEKLADEKSIKDLLSSNYFVADEANDILKHELHHKEHWDKIMSLVETNAEKDVIIVKQRMEQELREYVKNQISTNPFYIKNEVSLNAYNGYEYNDSVNELIAEVLLQRDKGTVKDDNLLKIIEDMLK